MNAIRPFPALAFGMLALSLGAQTRTQTPPNVARPLDASSVADSGKPATVSVASVMATATAADWRGLDPENTLYLDLPSGRVIIELSPQFAPAHAANVKALVREGYFDGLTINRLQDNYVAQWGDASPTPQRRAIRSARASLPAEFDQALQASLPFVPNPDGDLYAAEAGWTSGFPVARDPQTGRAWIAHCYGTLGTARGNDADSGGGTQLFVVIGHAPRHLDRNDTAFGRVVKGIEHLSSLPRGTGSLGFYEKPEQRVPIQKMRVAADLKEAERTPVRVLRTDSSVFKALIGARRTRTEEWFKFPVGKIELCNVGVPSK